MNLNRTNSLVIQTPEGIVFSLLIADPVTRFLAWGIDQICILALTSLFGKMIFLSLAWLNEDVAVAVYTILYFLISIGYPILMEWYWRGQTLGKRLLRLRVMDAQGFRLQFSQIVIRNLLRFVDFLPLFYLVGGVTAFFSKFGQRLGDIAANTIVIYQPSASEPDLDQIMAGKYNSFRGHPHLAARLRQRTSPKEGMIALQALMRRNEFDASARVELFQQIALHLKKIVEFPTEITEGLADEQYVRNCVDILFRKDFQDNSKPAAKASP